MKKRMINHLCPNCLSTLKIDKIGYVCTGDRIKLWQKELLTFHKMDEVEKKEYLKNISDIDKFNEFYEQKDNLSCELSDMLLNYNPSNSFCIPDPMIVGKIEISLARKLTDLELEENFIFYRNGKSFLLTPTIGYSKFVIPRIKFPEDC